MYYEPREEFIQGGSNPRNLQRDHLRRQVLATPSSTLAKVNKQAVKQLSTTSPTPHINVLTPFTLLDAAQLTAYTVR